MKKAILSTIGIWAGNFLIAQGSKNGNPDIPQSHAIQDAIEPNPNYLYVETFAAVILGGLLVFMTITLVKFILDHRLKNKIIDRGVSEKISTAILEKSIKNKSDEAMKYAILLCGMAFGLIVTYYTLPVHIHSLAIMALCIGASFLGYFFYLKQQDQ
ncbi:MAG TPA: hypothetical protein PKC30_06690 [Saprospiraceae bacterium]|nr:hypothetical protein [Saprospiraceae bacterium]